jgi:hypothetical protein
MSGLVVYVNLFNRYYYLAVYKNDNKTYLGAQDADASQALSSLSRQIQ